MARFEPARRVDVMKDAANLRTSSVFIARWLLQEDIGFWRRPAAASSLVEGRPKSIASFLLERAEETLQERDEASALAGVALLGPLIGSGTNLREQKRRINAAYAISLLLRTMLKADVRYFDANSTIQRDTITQGNIDFQIELRNGAHTLIVKKARLSREPFPEENPTASRSGEAWYRSREDGLYVAARWPARPSPQLLADLTQATENKDRESALAIIDVPNSVALQPYLSIQYLADMAR